MSNAVDPFAQTALLAKVHHNESLVWFQSSGLWFTINTGASLRFFLDSLLLLQKNHGDPGVVSTGPVALGAPAGHRWSRCWNEPTQSPECGLGW